VSSQCTVIDGYSDILPHRFFEYHSCHIDFFEYHSDVYRSVSMFYTNFNSCGNA
jgi:hypothetical protein